MIRLAKSYQVLLCWLCCMVLSLPSHAVTGNAKPNILIFMADDLTYRDIGAYGNKDVKTPNIDEFAARSLKFNYTFSSSAMCSPTRTELYTGLHPVRNGVHANHTGVHDHVRSVPDYLRPAGYRVALLGKGHVGPRKNFSFERLTDKSNAKAPKQPINLNLAREFIQQTEQPWFLMVASHQPHGPWNQGDPSQYDPQKLSIPEYFEDTPELREALTLYYAEINFLDSQFGQVLSYLKETKSKRDTLIIFLSEQGASFPFAKWSLYENGHRAAMLIAWHRANTTPKESNALIQYADILPTIIELTGQDPALLNLDGQSFVPLLRGQKEKHRDYVYGVHTTRGVYYGSNYPIRSIRSDQYRLIWNINYQQAFSNALTNSLGPRHVLKSWLNKGGKSEQRALTYFNRPEFELYDMKTDPYELNNLAGDSSLKTVQSRLFSELKAWMKQQGDQGLETELAVNNVLTKRAAKKKAAQAKNKK